MEKALQLIIDRQKDALINSGKTMKDVFLNMCAFKSEIFSEIDDGFRARKYTFEEMHGQVCRAADAIYEKIGATHGYVALEAENCIEWPIAFWAILKSGNKPYLVNCRHPKALSASIVETLGIKYIFAMHKGELEGEYINITSLLSGAEKSVPDDEFENEFALSTSATTLKEVICKYDGERVSEQILDAEKIIVDCERMATHYHGSLKHLAFLPFYHVFGLFAVHFWFSYFGRTLVFLRDYAPETIIKTIKKHEVTHIFAVPMLWHTIEEKINREVREQGEKKEAKFRKGIKICTKLQNIAPNLGRVITRKIMREVDDKLFGDSVAFCISGGSYVRNSTLELFNGIGYPLYNGYGMSETGITSVELRNKPKYRNLNSVGQPFASVEYKITENGTLAIRGTSICKSLTVNGKTTMQDGWFDTNDIAEEKDGYYYILGRRGDGVIGENGENINPDVIEQYFRIPEAKAFSILGLGEGAGEELTMIVQISPYIAEELIGEMVENVYKTNESVPSAARVRKFYVTHDAIASETAIKVSRPYLKRALDAGEIKLTPFSEARSLASTGENGLNTRVAAKVRECVAEVMGIEAGKIGDDAHFIFDLGASSLQYFAIVGLLAKEFSISSYSEKENYRYTVRECSEYIERHLDT